MLKARNQKKGERNNIKRKSFSEAYLVVVTYSDMSQRFQKKFIFLKIPNISSKVSNPETFRGLSQFVNMCKNKTTICIYLSRVVVRARASCARPSQFDPQICHQFLAVCLA